jgi:hypothetical protein
MGREELAMHPSVPTLSAKMPSRKPVPSAAAGSLSAVWQTARDFFSLDLRSLALFRVLLAYLLLADLANRWPDLTALYSDQGAVPRHNVEGGWLLDITNPFSIHSLSGSPNYQVFLHVLTNGFAIGLLVGYRTQLMTLLSWFLLMSAQARNPALMQGGDLLLRLLAFWGLFLPLGAIFSIDAATTARRLNRTYRVCTPASVALILQICFVYWFAVAWKSAPPWREEGTAVYLALSVDGFVTRLGQFLHDFVPLTKLLTRFTMVLELFGPVLLFVPFANGLLRTLVIAAFIMFHAGLGLCLELGDFPPICWVAWLALLPTWFWLKLAQRLHNPLREALVLYYDATRRAAGPAAALLRTFLLLHEAELVPLAEEETQQALAAKKRSWLVAAVPGKDVTGYEAIVFLARLSPLFGLLADVLNWRIIRSVGTWLFVRIGASRIVPPAEPLAEAPAPPRASLVQNTLVVFFIVYVFACNVRTLPSLSPWAVKTLANVFDTDVGTVEKMITDKSWLPPMAMNLAAVLGVDQSWGVFAPQPGTEDGWFVIVGKLKDGREVNLFTGGRPLDEVKIEPPSWEKPALVSAMYVNTRWRKYLINLYLRSKDPRFADPYGQLRPYFADYLSREWNAGHSGNEELASLEIYLMAKTNGPPDTPPPVPVKDLLLRWDCVHRKPIPEPGASP